jgi:hypothetical protein
MSKRKFEQEQGIKSVQDVVFKSLLTNGPCTTSLSNLGEIDDILDNIDIGLISADALCKHTHNIQAISEKKTEKPLWFRYSKKVFNKFDASVSSLMSFIGGATILHNVSQLPFPMLPGTDHLQTGLIASATMIALNKVAIPILESATPDILVKGPETLLDEDALKCIKVYNRLDNGKKSDCNKNIVLSCRDVYIKYHYLDKGVNMIQLHNYINITSLLKKIFIEHMNYNEKNNIKKDIKYINVQKLWVGVLTKSHNSNHDFSIVLLLLLNLFHPDQVYYSNWENSILTLTTSVLKELKTENEIHYKNCIVSLAMMDTSLNYISDEIGYNNDNTSEFLKTLDTRFKGDVTAEKKVIKDLYKMQSIIPLKKRRL